MNRRPRCKRAVRHLFAGRFRALGLQYGKRDAIVLRCYDEGRLMSNAGPGSRWNIWAANCRDERDLLP